MFDFLDADYYFFEYAAQYPFSQTSYSREVCRFPGDLQLFQKQPIGVVSDMSRRLVRVRGFLEFLGPSTSCVHAVRHAHGRGYVKGGN